MKNQWLAYVVVAVISVLAGVAIAGTPTSTPNAPTIVAAATTVATTTPAPEPTVEETLPSSTVPATTEAPAEVSSTTTPAPETTTTTTEPPIDRASVVVVAVNGAGVVGIAGRTRDELNFFGYAAARATDGAIAETTEVYYFEGSERAAAEVALDLGLDPFRVRPVEEAPEFGSLPGDEVVAYIGRDRS